MRFHTRSVLEGELVLELGKLSVTYLTAHCEIFVRITEAAPRAPVRALLADRVISFGHLPSLRRALSQLIAFLVQRHLFPKLVHFIAPCGYCSH